MSASSPRIAGTSATASPSTTASAGTASRRGPKNTIRSPPSFPAHSPSSFPERPPAFFIPATPGIPNTLAPIDALDVSPRLGIAWSPHANGAFLQKILGAPGTTSIRASFGTFYTAIDALSISVLAANAPYGTTYTSPAPPLFATPFVSAADGINYGQPFPYKFAPLNSSRSHPDANIDWTAYEPISGIPGYDIHNRTPYTEEWMLSIERQAGPNTVLERQLRRHRHPSSARSRRGQLRQSRALPQPQPVQRSQARHRSPAEPTAKTPSTSQQPAAR